MAGFYRCPSNDQTAPNAIDVHCKAHSLNLAIGHACKDTLVRIKSQQDVEEKSTEVAIKIKEFLKGTLQLCHRIYLT